MKEVIEIPVLRFPNFTKKWELKRIDEVLKKVSKPVELNDEELYQEIGIRSHGRGIFYKDSVTGKSIGKKRVFWIVENAFIVNIVFAWEQAIAKTTNNEIGKIASHRFPQFKPINEKIELNFIFYFFLTSKGKHLLGLASPGGAGRNKTLGQKEFAKLKLRVPDLPEQEKIALFLSKIDLKIELLKEKRKLLLNYQKGVIQQLFSQELRFRKEGGNSYSDWEKKELRFFLKERKLRNKEGIYEEVFSVAKSKGVINQIEHLGRSYASSNLSNYKVTYPFDVVYTKSPTANFPFGIVKQNKLNRTGLVSVLYAVYEPKNKYIGTLIDYYFSSFTNTYNYLNPIVRKGAKNTINIGNSEFLKGRKISLPTSEIEQEKIVNFLDSISKKNSLVKQQIEKMEAYKKGLLQQMFV